MVAFATLGRNEEEPLGAVAKAATWKVWVSYQSLLQLRRRLRAGPDLHPRFERAWEALATGHPPVGAGSVGKVWTAMARLGWEWAEPWTFERPGLPPLCVRGFPSSRT